MNTVVAAAVGGRTVTVADVDERERAARRGPRAAALPRPGTSEARQLRRWLTQVLVAETVVALEAAGVDGLDPVVPAEAELLPDTVAHLELGSVAAATLATPEGRAMFVRVTAAISVSAEEIADYHRRNPTRFAPQQARPGDWQDAPVAAGLDVVGAVVAEHLLAAARRRHYRRWLDARCAELVVLGPGYEHPGDPRQPDNTHRH